MIQPTTDAHPVLGLRDKLERVSRTAATTEAQYRQSEGTVLAQMLKKLQASVDKKVAGRERAGTFYYITYEVVIDNTDGDGEGRPVWSHTDGPATGVVLDGMQQRGAKAA